MKNRPIMAKKRLGNQKCQVSKNTKLKDLKLNSLVSSLNFALRKLCFIVC